MVGSRMAGLLVSIAGPLAVPTAVRPGHTTPLGPTPDRQGPADADPSLYLMPLVETFAT